MEWLLRAMLLLAPAAYRERYADSLLADFHSCVDEAGRKREPAFPLMVKAFADLLFAIVREQVTFSTRALLYAVRSLARTPGITLAMIFTLALGIGANVAGFTIVSGVLLSPLPYPQANRMVAVWTKVQLNNTLCTTCSSSLFTSFAYRDGNSAFESLAAYHEVTSIVSDGGSAVNLGGVAVGTQFLNVVGMRPQLGRGFVPGDERTSAPSVVMLSDELWAQRYDRDPSAIGRTIMLDGKPARIVGVMPRNFLFPNFTRVGEHPAFFIAAKRTNEDAGVGGWGIVGRLKPNVGDDQAASDLDRIIARLARSRPDVYRIGGHLAHANVVPLAQDLFGPMRVLLLPLFGAVFIVLLIACVNVANLLIARTVGRQRDLAMRVALGARGVDIARELLTEAAVLAAAAAVIGLAGAFYGVRAYAALHPAGVYRVDQISIDARVIGYAVGIAALAAVATSVLPALVLMRGRLFASLKDGRSRVGTRGTITRSVLVVVQIACAFSLVVACGLLVRSLQAYANVDLGFSTANLVAIEPPAVSAAFLPTEGAQTQYLLRLYRNLASLPGVASVAYSTAAPISNEANDQLVDVVDGPRNVDTLFQFVSPAYFATAGVPVSRGRAIGEQDRDGTRAVAVVNQEFVRRFITHGDPIGRAFLTGPIRYTIVGVVPTIAVNRVGEAPQPAIYLSIAQLPSLWHMTYSGFQVPFIVRLRAPLSTMKDTLLSAWRSADPREPMPALATMDELRVDQTANTLANAFILGVLAAIALMLAISGTASVAAYSAARRTSEIGVRIALGATRWNIVRLLIHGAALLLCAGLAAGMLLASLASYALQPQLFGTRAFDPATYATVALILIAATLVASFIPAYRAASIQPSRALRYE